MEAQPIRILLVDDDASFPHSLEALIDAAAGAAADPPNEAGERERSRAFIAWLLQPRGRADDGRFAPARLGGRSRCRALSNSSTEPSEDKVRVRRRSAGLAEIKSYVSGPRPTASEPHCSASALKRLSGR